MERQTTKETSFTLEAQLCDVLASTVLHALNVGRRAAVLKEVQVGPVIPDLMIVSAEAEATAVGTLTGFESWIIAADERGKRAREETTS